MRNLHDSSAASPLASSPFRIGEPLDQGLGKATRTIVHNGPSRLADHLPRSSDVGGDNTPSPSHRLEHHERHSLPTRWKGDDVRCCDPVRNVFAMTNESHARPRAAPQALGLWTVADKDEACIRHHFANGRPRVYEHVLSLCMREPGNANRDGCVRRESEPFSCELVFLRPRLRIDLEIDSILDHPPPRSNSHGLAKPLLGIADAKDLVGPASSEPLPGCPDRPEGALERLERPAVRLENGRYTPSDQQPARKSRDRGVQVDQVRWGCPDNGSQRCNLPAEGKAGLPLRSPLEMDCARCDCRRPQGPLLGRGSDGDPPSPSDLIADKSGDIAGNPHAHRLGHVEDGERSPTHWRFGGRADIRARANARAMTSSRG